jgi:hypothetical protein
MSYSEEKKIKTQDVFRRVSVLRFNSKFHGTALAVLIHNKLFSSYRNNCLTLPYEEILISGPIQLQA